MPEPDPKVLAAELAANPFANVVSSTSSNAERTHVDDGAATAPPPATQEPAR